MRPDDKTWSGRRRRSFKRRFKAHPALAVAALGAALASLIWATSPLFPAI